MGNEMKEKLRPGNEEILQVDVRMKSGGSNQVGWTHLVGWRGMLAPDAEKLDQLWESAFY